MATRKSLYKSVWYWDEETALTYCSPSDGKDKTAKTQTRNLTQASEMGEKYIHFLENVDQQQQKMFKQMFQRQVKPNVPNVVTIQDIKDVVTFLLVGPIPKSIVTLIHSNQINSLLRTLILYFQIYLQVWDDLKYRRSAYGQNRLKHPISVLRETCCKTRLSQLRSLAGQEYALLITGEGFYRRFHHMDNPLNRSYTTKDVLVYEYLTKVIARVVWVALYRSNYKEIEAEVARLFHLKHIREELKTKSVESILTESDLRVLHGDKLNDRSQWDKTTPLVSDIFVNDDNPALLLMDKGIGTNNLGVDDEMPGLEALLVLPEELLVRFGLTLGILGQPRDNFEAMLHVKQGPPISLEEEIEKALVTLESEAEKPAVKMYQYLKELETNVDVNATIPNGNEVHILDVREEINFYLYNHKEDGKRALSLWKNTKGCK